MRIIPLWIVFFLLPGFSAAASQGFILRYEVSTSGGEKQHRVESEYSVQGDDVRVEVDLENKQEGGVVVITLDRLAKAYALFPQDQTYVEVPQKILRKDLSKMVEEKGRYQSTGKKKKVSGNDCEVWERNAEGFSEEVCVSDKLLPTEAFHSLMLTDLNRRTPFLPPGVPAFPVEYVSKRRSITDKDRTTTYQVKLLSFTQKDLAKNLFSIPQKYEEKDYPSYDVTKSEEIMNRRKVPDQVPLDKQYRMNDIKSWVMETQY